MITIKIENQETELSRMTDQWVIENIERRRRDGQDDICVRVIIDEPDCHIAFSKNCDSIGSVKKTFCKKEKEIIRLWENHHLNNNFDTGEYVKYKLQAKNREKERNIVKIVVRRSFWMIGMIHCALPEMWKNGIQKRIIDDQPVQFCLCLNYRLVGRLKKSAHLFLAIDTNNK